MFKLPHSLLQTLRSTSKNVFFIRHEKMLKSTIAAVEAKNLDEYPKAKSNNRMVAAAFASLKPHSNLEEEIQTPITDERIKRATNIDDLLSISDGSGISRRHALKVVSTLAEWSSLGKVKVSDFENDTRFIKLCRVLTKGAKINKTLTARNEDLSTILNVTADEEAARLISSLSLDQMVKVMSTLSMKKRRSVLLLRTLAFNLSSSSEQLNLKQSADLLYSMCILNFVDNNLLEKICGDVNIKIKNDLKGSAVVGSIIRSLGVLKYKNCETLDILSEWILKNHSICRSQDIFNLFTTLATVNYYPTNSEQLFKAVVPQLTMAEARTSSVWLNFVWSLVILNKASENHISSVLSNEFIEKIETNISAKLKILNINAAAQYLINYKGTLLSSSSCIYDITLTKSKEKIAMKELVLDTLKNLINIENNVRFDTNTGLGFPIDIECFLDKKCNPLPVDDCLKNKANIFKIAILLFDYHDMCLGKIEPCGPNVLGCRLIKAQNYKILPVTYNDFKSSDKLIHRVQYLENKLKNIVK